MKGIGVKTFSISFAEPGMRVGNDFQAAIPELVSESKFVFMFRVFNDYSYSFL